MVLKANIFIHVSPSFLPCASSFLESAKAVSKWKGSDPGLTAKDPVLNKSFIRRIDLEDAGIKNVADIQADGTFVVEHIFFGTQVNRPVGPKFTLGQYNRPPVIALQLEGQKIGNRHIGQQADGPAEVGIAKAPFNVFATDFRVKEISRYRRVKPIGKL